MDPNTAPAAVGGRGEDLCSVSHDELALSGMSHSFVAIERGLGKVNVPNLIGL